MGLVDVWRVHHPVETQYTFHSGAHKSLSRIDYILAPAAKVGNVKEVRHLVRGISDHSPIWLQMEYERRDCTRVAPISPWYLRNPIIKLKIEQEIEYYFNENEGTVESAQVLWEAFKTVIRGQALSQISGAKKEKQARLLRLEEEILKLEEGITASTEQDTTQILKLTQEEYGTEAREAAKTMISHKLGRVYELGDKAGKLLAWLDRRETASQLVTELWTVTGRKLTDPQDMADEFGKYSEHIYTARSTRREAETKELLTEICLPLLAEEGKN